MPDQNSGPRSPAYDLDRASEEMSQGRKRHAQHFLDLVRIKIAEYETVLTKLKTEVNARDTLITKITDERNAMKVSLNDAAVAAGEQQTHIGELQETVNALMVPPHNYAVIAGLNPEDGTADVFYDGLRSRVGIHPAVNVESLTCGTTVVINGASRTVQQVIDEDAPTGMQVTLTELLDNGRAALVEDARGEKRIVLVGHQVLADALEPRTPVVLRESVIVRSMRTDGRSLGSGSRFLLAEMPNITFEDIGGLDTEVQELVASLENPYRAEKGYEIFKHKKTFSALLFGLPGMGKTMLAKAIARREFDKHREAILKYAKGNFFLIEGTALYDKWLGNTEGALSQIFEDAQTLYRLTGAVSTIFFDDCDAFFLTRSAGLSTNINASVNTLFSAIVDGVREMKGINLFAATNRLDLVDTAVARRFDRQVRIPPPDTPEKASAVLHKHLDGIPIVGGTTDEVVKRIVENLFARSRDNEALEVVYRKDGGEEDSDTIMLSQMISGKFLKDIVVRAKDLAITRVLAMPEDERVWALTSDELIASLNSELRKKESLPSNTETVADWLMQKGDKRVVEYVVNLRERRRSEEKRNRALDDKVV